MRERRVINLTHIHGIKSEPYDGNLRVIALWYNHPDSVFQVPHGSPWCSPDMRHILCVSWLSLTAG